MNNTFRLVSIKKHHNRIDFDYKIDGEWTKYFVLTQKMFAEYSFDVEEVPDSVVVIPLMGNILPIAWICDAEIILDALDWDFYQNLDKVKKGYADMYPMINFTGKVTVANVVSNQDNKGGRSAAFFSGGVDAYTTLLRHIKEKPYLISLWGADVKLQDTAGWKKVKEHIRSVSEGYGLDAVYIRTNFRESINERELDALVHKSGDGWWHGFQHGIGIISHAAPSAYRYGIQRTYIASSYPEKMKGQYTCASDPTIDNNIEYCGCKTIHDGYELDRQEKVQFLVSKKREGNPIKLRVCWEIQGGGNCCRCEKCYRTILEIVSEGENPDNFGFVWTDSGIKRCEKDLKNKIRMRQCQWDQYYFPIQQMFKENAAHIPDIDKYRWIQQLDFARINNRPVKILRYSVPARGLRKLLRVLRGRKGKTGVKCQNPE